MSHRTSELELRSKSLDGYSLTTRCLQPQGETVAVDIGSESLRSCRGSRRHRASDEVPDLIASSRRVRLDPRGGLSEQRANSLVADVRLADRSGSRRKIDQAIDGIVPRDVPLNGSTGWQPERDRRHASVIGGTRSGG